MKKSLFATLPIVAAMAISPFIASSVLASAGPSSDWNGLDTCIKGELNRDPVPENWNRVCGGAGVIDDWNGPINITSGKEFELMIGPKYADQSGLAILKASSENAYINVETGATLTLSGVSGGTIISNFANTQKGIITLNGSSDSAHPTTLIIEGGIAIEGINPVVINTSTGDNVKIVIKGSLNNTTLIPGVVNSALQVPSSASSGVIIEVTGSLSSTVGTGLFQAGSATTTLSGSITGLTGILVKSGTVTLSNATVTATGSYVPGTDLSGTDTPSGAALQINAASPVQRTANNIAVNINDNSKLISQQGNAIQVYGAENAVAPAIAMTNGVSLVSAAGYPVLGNFLSTEVPVTVNGTPVDLLSTSVYPIPTPTAPDATQESSASIDSDEANPDTADPIALYLTIAVVALLGLGTTILVAKKTNR